jgi:hypothetical protein
MSSEDRAGMDGRLAHPLVIPAQAGIQGGL